MSLLPDESETVSYWRNRASNAEQKNNSIRVTALVVMAVCLSVSMMLGLALLGQGAKFEDYKETKVNYEPHSVEEFNNSTMKTIAETRNELDLGQTLPGWENTDNRALTDSFRGCALGLYEHKAWTPDECVIGDLPEGVELQVDAIRFESGAATAPDSGLPTQDQFKKRLKAEQNSKDSKDSKTSKKEEQEDAPYVTSGKPHVLKKDTTRQFVYVVGGNGGDWVVYIFSEHPKEK